MHGSSLQQPLLPLAGRHSLSLGAERTRTSAPVRKSKTASGLRTIHLVIDCPEQSNDQLDADCRRDTHLYMDLTCNTRYTSCRFRRNTYAGQLFVIKSVTTWLGFGSCRMPRRE
jgi:hypothetical protein